MLYVNVGLYKLTYTMFVPKYMIILTKSQKVDSSITYVSYTI